MVARFRSCLRRVRSCLNHRRRPQLVPFHCRRHRMCYPSPAHPPHRMDPVGQHWQRPHRPRTQHRPCTTRHRLHPHIMANHRWRHRITSSRNRQPLVEHRHDRQLPSEKGKPPLFEKFFVSPTNSPRHFSIIHERSNFCSDLFLYKELNFSVVLFVVVVAFVCLLSLFSWCGVFRSFRHVSANEINSRLGFPFTLFLPLSRLKEKRKEKKRKEKTNYQPTVKSITTIT